MESALEIRIDGIVQGVGFRPYVLNLAQTMDIAGSVQNTPYGVKIHIEGKNLNLFVHNLLEGVPPLAQVSACEIVSVQSKQYRSFKIITSADGKTVDTLSPPDSATCEECSFEISDPTDRRYNYPFTTCTNCGPRFTIHHKNLFERVNTTMAEFKLCTECASEYADPKNRRFHAQSIACPKCGPQAVLKDNKGAIISGLGAKELSLGFILAVKGLGGYHLTCNAFDSAAVRELRRRKNRIAKPFALMAKNIEVVRKYCRVDEIEAALLQDKAAPIVCLKQKKSGESHVLSDELAPGIDTLGIMLPYTPLHHFMMADNLELVVMTSANLSGEPLIIDDQTASLELKGIADYFLVHNRKISVPCDDSVVRVINGKVIFLRRGRGYVPQPILLDRVYPTVLALGSDLKNTICQLSTNKAVLSQPCGDLAGYENYLLFQKGVLNCVKKVSTELKAVVFDLHPEYYSSRYARFIDIESKAIKLIGVQHHFAHLVGCLAENRVSRHEKVLGVVCDGAGYGLDAKIWGFEFFVADYTHFQRVGHLEYLPLPGGDAATKYPLRIAAGYLARLFGELQGYKNLFKDIGSEELSIIFKQSIEGFNNNETSSCGRLIDAVAALGGFKTTVQYEGQAAIELEAAIVPGIGQSYPFEIECANGPAQLRVKDLFAAILDDLNSGTAKGVIAAKFHNTLTEMIVRMLCYLSKRYEIREVALSGGVFQNKYLLERLVQELENSDFKVYLHSQPGDGGLSLGQAVASGEVMTDVSGGAGSSPESA